VLVLFPAKFHFGEILGEVWFGRGGNTSLGQLKYLEEETGGKKDQLLDRVLQ